VDENEVRSGGGQAETGTRRVGDARREQEEDRKRRESELGTSWTSVVFGWLAALGAGLILSGLLGAVVAAILGALGVKGGTEGGVTGLVGVLVTLFAAFLIGGYVAGRLASRSGLKHGILVPVLSRRDTGAGDRGCRRGRELHRSALRDRTASGARKRPEAGSPGPGHHPDRLRRRCASGPARRGRPGWPVGRKDRPPPPVAKE